jgi:hypothetical protein
LDCALFYYKVQLGKNLKFIFTMAVKRKNEEDHVSIGVSKKRALSNEEAQKCFGSDVFAKRDEFTKQYAQSQP